MDPRAGSLLSRWVFDTGVWLELAFGGSASTKILEIPARGHEVFASPVSLAEIVSVLTRQGRQELVAPTLKRLRGLCRIPMPSEADFEEAGAIHAAERARHSDLALADALVLQLARALGATVLTTDGGLMNNQAGVRAKLT